ncbi:hypothetical protein AX769_09300 [Frondihabitans sp. PAMC 28766]|nr:hypothetical protein AX769_09300 [Frondihabitans sp. PAMC 28766]
MLASFEHIVPKFPLTWNIATLAEPGFHSVWHFHPEFELTYIRAGHGTRLVGDSVGDYVPGQLTLIGPEVPHTYVSTPGSDLHIAVVAQFRSDFVGEAFFDAPVFESVSRLLTASSRGLSFTCADARMSRLESLPPAEKTLELLSLLLDLSRREPTYLATDQRTPALNRATAGRIEAMVSVMHEEYASKLTLDRIAAAAHLAPSSASRLFSQCTGSTITTYLNVVRVNVACRLLRDSDRSVADISVECGFTNLSNFNRRFRDVKNVTPREFRTRSRIEVHE